MNYALPIFNRYRRVLMLRLVLYGIAQLGMMLVTAVMIKEVFDLLASPSGWQEGQSSGLIINAAIIVAATCALALLRMFERVDAERMGQSYVHQLRMHLFDHMGRLSPRVLQRRSRGGIFLRFVGDLTALRQWIGLGVARLSVAAITTLGAVAALAFVNRWLALAVGLSLALGILTIIGLGPWLQGRVRQARRQRARLAANVSEKIGHLGVVQVHGQIKREQRRVQKQSSHLKQAMIKRAVAIGSMRGLLEFISGLASVAALTMGAILVMSGQISLGTVVAAMSIVGLLTPALKDLGRVQEYRQGAIVSSEKIQNFMATQALDPNGRRQANTDTNPNLPELCAGQGDLVFENVSVTGALKGFSATANAGQMIALVGPNGAGKSTILSLAARLLDPEQGRVLLDESDITKVQLNSLRANVGMVTPDLPLLRGSLERNLKYRKPRASAQELAQVSQLCGLEALLEALPLGEKTRIIEDGANLSLGQRQRLMMARALLGNPRLLLLDEADANLDASAGAALRRIIQHYEGTILMVSHRPDWIAMADKVWHLADGQLLESGAPQALLQGTGPTATLFHQQLHVAHAS